MGQDIHIARLNVLADDTLSKYRTRKLENLYAPSVLVKKFETSGIDIPESHVKGRSSSSCLNADMFSKQVLEDRTVDFRIRSLSNFDKSKKIMSTSVIKKKTGGGIVSLSSDGSIRSTSTHSKIRKLVEENIISGAENRRSKDSGKTKSRKHLHVRTYKNLFRKHAITGGNHGESTSQEVSGGKDQDCTEANLHDERELYVETTDVINQEHQNKFSEFRYKRATLNLESVTSLESSSGEMHNYEPCKINMESSSILEDSLSEYRPLLSLNNGGTVDAGLVSMKVDSIESPVALSTSKEKLAQHIAYECEAESSKFLEYWVPVPLSSVQLEQYCEILISNANVLRSNSKSDVVGALHNIIITARKCCDHPYLVDGDLHGLLTKGLQGVEVLNAEVCASGKLYLLGKILQEMRNCGLRVLILFQTLGKVGKISLGDILDDFLQQRFGEDSFERIENGMIMSKRLAALKKFNSKKAGIFAFLLEKRACLPSVKLQYVDVIILFDNDWNPLRDIRSIQKIGIESPRSSIKVFRLYTSCTVEEKILMLAKQDIVLDNCVYGISHNIIHSLLGWGASYLLQKLDLLHSNASPTCIPEASFGKLCLNDVISEILTQLPGKVEINRTAPCSFLMKAQLIGGTYLNNIVLVGEKEDILLPDKDLSSFWSRLLEGRHPKWIHISGQSQRIRKRIQNINGLVISSVVNDEVMNKRQKISNIVKSTMLPECSQEILTNSNVASVELPECSQENRNVPKEIHGSDMVDSRSRDHKFVDQSNLLMLLIPELSELCATLGLPESVKGTAEEFLVYILNNHEVCLDQVTMLQALKISLCWHSASILRYRLDHIESLAIAKNKLKFECTELEACSIYSKLKILKEKDPCQLKNLSMQSIQNSQPLSETSDTGNKLIYGRTKETSVSNNATLEETVRFPIVCHHDHYLVDEIPGKFQYHNESLKDDLLKTQIDMVEQIFLRRSEVLVQNQQAEVAKFEKQVYDDRMKLEKAHDSDLDLICAIHADSTIRNEKLDVLTQIFSTKMGWFYRHLKHQRQKLRSMQHDRWNKEQELKHNLLKRAKTGKMDVSFDDLPELESCFTLERFSEYAGNYEFGGTKSGFAGPSLEENAVSQSFSLVPSVILKGQDSIDKVYEESSMSGIVGSVDNMEQNRACAELSHVPKLAGVQISAPQAGYLNSYSRRSAHIPLTASVTEAFFDSEQLKNRDDSNDLHLIPSPETNQDEVLSSLQGFTHSVPSNSFSSIEVEFPVLNALEASVVESETSVEQISENAFSPVRPLEDQPLERTFLERRECAGFQPFQPNQLFQNPLSIEWVPHQAIYADPLQNELIRIQKHESACAKNHETKKLQLQIKCETQELEKIRKKLLQDLERDYLSDKMVLEDIRHKVCWHKVFAEEVRAQFFDHKEGLLTSLQDRIRNSSQHPQASRSQPQFPVRPSPTPAPPILPSTSTINLASTARPRPPSLHTRSSSQTTPPLISTHTIHRPLTPRPITIQVGRSPAPHLQPLHASLTPATNHHCMQSRPSTSIRMPSIAPTRGFSQPSMSRASPLHFNAPLLELPQYSGADDLLESLLADFPATGEELPATNVMGLRPDVSPEIICLSDEE